MKENDPFSHLHRWKLRKLLKIMKLTMFFVVLGMMQTLASLSYSQNVRFNLKLENASLETLLSQIKGQSEFASFYDDAVASKIFKINIDIKGATIETILNKSLNGTGISYKITDKTIVLFRDVKNTIQEIPLQQKKIIVKGTVVNSKGEQLVGVSVVIKGTGRGAVTKADGTYELILPKTEGITLVFSFIGMQAKEVKYKGQETINIELQDEIQKIDNVVVNGMFERKKEGFTGSATKISGDVLKQYSANNLAKAIQAIEPGFRIVDNNAMGSDPNALPTWQLRGESTVQGTNITSSSAIAFKGEYTSNPNQPLLILDGFEVTLQKVVDIPIEKIESITLLKDAAAAAIYGSKAANGVMVIESKKTLPGKLRVTYNSNMSIQIPDLTDYNLCNASQKLEMETISGVYGDRSTKQVVKYNELYLELLRGVNTYWLSKPLQIAVQQRHSLGIEGGTNEFRYNLNVGFQNAPGVMKGSSKKLETGSLSISYRFAKFIFRNNITVDNLKGSNSPWGNFSEYAKIDPYYRAYDANGNVLKVIDNNAFGVGYVVTNPIYNATLNTKNYSTNFDISNQTSLEFRPINKLRLIADINIVKNSSETHVFRPAQHTAFETETNPIYKGDYSLNTAKAFNYGLNVTAMYNTVIKNDHVISLNARYSISEQQSNNILLFATGFPNQFLDDILMGQKLSQTISGGEGTTRAIGVVGAINYSWKQRYAVDYNVRMDGSSQFGDNNRFAPFWSTGLRWNVYNEKFIQRIKFVSNLVLRASYGTTGSQGFPPYQSKKLYTYSNLSSLYTASNGVGTELVGLDNPNLKWQTTKQLNVGVEFGFFENRITGRAEYYGKSTDNLVTDMSVAPSTGFSSYTENIGGLENKGYEFTLTVMPYKNYNKLAYWTISVNASHNIDKLIHISDALKVLNETNAAATQSKPLSHYMEGESINRIWVVKSLGIDPISGQEVFQKRNGDLTYIWDATDMVPLGNTQPTLYGNINSYFTYKGFGLNVNCIYSVGSQVYNSTLVDKIENVNIRYNVDQRALDLRWKNVGDLSRYKGISFNGSSTKASSRFVMDNDEFRLSSVALSYRFDTERFQKLKSIGLSSLLLSFNMEDVFRISTVKQERGTSYPFAQVFSLSVSATL